MDRYAVIGNPIEHSRSPQIHAAFAAQTGQALTYERILGDPAGFEDQVREFFSAGGLGLNVTVPFKERAHGMADDLGDAAAAAGAVNTLRVVDGLLRGDNTDGVGLTRDLGCNHRFDFRGSQLLLLGAGGAARGVLRPLLQERPDRLVVANRTAAKAVALAAALGDERVRGCGFDGLSGQRFDLVINATASGLSDQVPDIPDNCLADGGWTYDMMYGATPTAFVDWGRTHGAAKALDGLGMLVEQAAESFRLWRAVEPVTDAVIDALRSS